jgi:hypothetical protein
VSFVYLYQAIVRQGAKALKRVRKVDVEGLWEGRGNRVLGNLHRTHQLVDDKAPPPILPGQASASYGRHLAGIERSVIVAEAFGVLCVRVVKLTDGRYPKPEYLHGGLRRVSLNIAVDCACV